MDLKHSPRDQRVERKQKRKENCLELYCKTDEKKEKIKQHGVGKKVWKHHNTDI